MSDFVVRTAEQLPALLQAFRKQSGLTQADTAVRLGVSQQAFSALERNAEKASADRLLELLSILGVELVLRKPDETPTQNLSAGPRW
ncbi:helix-turn-helix domain-containing protein [Cupriavidus agavae]|uniref:HTH-type transcriptional regulator/antitoxin HipB n=1 Tax=Cupriavidus agavae TaxID=1001822 RepID=A0A4Q7RB16_9BURK|nr:helix-turn-helix transcriptional regulator [Cupriavidus agavae]RZT28842.1 HTH-type transcriptional regulator/antitoxin HipB [Cupriavidus agavae]